MALLPAMALLPVLFMLCYRRQLPLSFLLPAWDNGYAALLSKFTVMALITAVTLPVAYVMMRNLLARSEGWAAVEAVSLALWLLCDVAIRILFSAKFSAMSGLFAWQLVGDVLKVGAYVFGYLVLAQAALRIYLLAEITQFVLLTGFSHWLIPRQGALGATQAYMATYIVYFAPCGGVFLLYLRKK
ncbi:MAG: hypothetical protein ACR5LG_06445 [Sodalis sp. (in: enterobacteria)]|uniref:hypothetical protein n=1 Tax=Sodalis sp. (in: enterobacteria) TaxID=1898979 RepID=UPI003F2BD217